MSIDYGTDYQYADNRLTGTYVSYKGDIVYLRRVEADGFCMIMSLDSNLDSEVKLSDLDLTPIKLGYINFPRWASYVTRIPRRYFKQGLRNDILRSKAGNRISVDRNFLDCVRNNYPKPTTCLENVVNEEVESQAFSRNFAVKLHKDIPQLVYKDQMVGYWNDKKGEFGLKDRFFFLKEALNEVKMA